jgi:putative redox protein
MSSRGIPITAGNAEHEKASIRVSETGFENLQLVGRARHATLLMGGRAEGAEDFSNASPYDLLAAALASCTAMAVRVFAQRHAIPLDRVEVEVSHRRFAGNTHDLLRAVVFLHGPLEERQRVQLLEAAQACPISRTLLRGIDVGTFLHVNGIPDPETGARTDYLKDLGMFPEDPQDPRYR